MVADFSKKQNREKEDILFKTFVGIFLVVFLLLIFANVRLYLRKKELTDQVKNYSEQISKIQESSKKLEEQIANSEDKDYIEKVAREEANMQKSGEKAISFIMPEQDDNANQQGNNFWNNVWQKIKYFFK
ncbi:MAG: hypothetical protein A2599_01285 [Candidatus Staskawiczbacteria bacterium RIFOXYD1_FULL_39_28]|uniref:Cell division protein FtsL n=1 Tax=Candidatus Staskawiczbacteria bacterium RIFOXYC1_FULL_38_18 TaxID=1802229 RepID=A0A1G2JEL9_9BACT|nr:MAG: hypothetical protein A2401_02365 [Candidatus Staskawiczbacteria bacterium RIFOXYC1_FULL_38_18]OGZ92500.1 MAG: hypothetical protein A2599_01285 [Candidatus Staskawiczbacteria bacterium RIFOXYD1_FULL_39_28]